MSALLERESSGIRVEADYLGIMGEGVVRVEVNGNRAAHTVPPDKLLDAFLHPMVYLSAAQVAALFPRDGEESE